MSSWIKFFKSSSLGKSDYDMEHLKNFLCCILTMLPLGVMAQETEEENLLEPITYPQKQTPYGIDNYQAGFYYYNGKSVYNMRSYSMASGSEIKALKINPSGSSYAYINSKKEHNTILVNDLWVAKRELGKINSEGYETLAICYSADSKRLYVSCSDDSLRIYDSKSLLLSQRIDISFNATRLDASNNGYYLILSDNRNVQILNLETMRIRTSFCYESDIKDIAFSANSAMMAVLAADGSCKVYDTRTLEITHRYEAMGRAESCFFHPDNKYLAVVTGEQRIALINIMNDRDHNYIDAPEAGVSYVNFVRNTENGIYLVYNTNSSIIFTPMFSLSPNRQQLLKEELNSRMEEWMKRMDDETLEDYNNRVNEENMMAQIQLFETEISTRMADNLLSMSDISLGSYNQEMGMLTLDFNTMPSIYLSVPSDELIAFMDINALEFTNSKYCINENDEFELVYTEVVNKKNNQKYVFDNTERQSLAFLTSDDSFVPLDQMQMSQMEEMKLEEIRNNIMSAARDKNIISSHTHIDVSTKVVSDHDAMGKRISNYEVDVSYSVDENYSAADDFPSSKFKTDESAAAKAMLDVVKRAFEGDLSKYIVAGKQVKIMVSGMADAIPFSHTVSYDGCYGNFVREPVYKDQQLSNITVTTESGISDNDQLAFLRAMGVKDYIERNITSLLSMNKVYDASISVSKKAGSKYRRIGVKFTFIDAF